MENRLGTLEAPFAFTIPLYIITEFNENRVSNFTAQLTFKIKLHMPIGMYVSSCPENTKALLKYVSKTQFDILGIFKICLFIFSQLSV